MERFKIRHTTGLQEALDAKVNTTDPRLTDARPPTAHTHPASQITDFAQAVGQLLAAYDAQLKGGVPEAGNTLQKLYSLIVGQFSEVTVPTLAARDAYNVTQLPLNVFVQDDGDGRWAYYKALTTGTNAQYIKFSDPDLLGATLSPSAIKLAYESNDDTNAFTDAEKQKLAQLGVGASADLTKGYILRQDSTFYSFDTLGEITAAHEFKSYWEINQRFSESPVGSPLVVQDETIIEGNGNSLALNNHLQLGNYAEVRHLNLYQNFSDSARRRTIYGSNVRLSGGYWTDGILRLEGGYNIIEDVEFDANVASGQAYFATGQYWLSSSDPSSCIVRLRGYTVVPQFYLDRIQPGVTVLYERVLDQAADGDTTPAIPVRDVYAVGDNTIITTPVKNGTYINGELQGAQPAGSQAGDEFTTTTYGYKFQRGAAGTLVWCRYPKG